MILTKKINKKEAPLPPPPPSYKSIFCNYDSKYPKLFQYLQGQIRYSYTLLILTKLLQILNR